MVSGSQLQPRVWLGLVSTSCGIERTHLGVFVRWETQRGRIKYSLLVHVGDCAAHGSGPAAFPSPSAASGRQHGVWMAGASETPPQPCSDDDAKSESSAATDPAMPDLIEANRGGRSVARSLSKRSARCLRSLGSWSIVRCGARHLCTPRRAPSMSKAYHCGF